MATWLTYHQFLTDREQAWIQLQDSIFQDQVRDQDKTLSCEITTLKNKVSKGLETKIQVLRTLNLTGSNE